MPRFSIIPREPKFFDLFEKGGRNMVIAAQQLKDLIHNWENVEKKIDAIINGGKDLKRA